MADPFEEPAKTEMRARCEIAIDQSGHELVDTVARLPLPAEAGLNGMIKGDLQSLDGEGTRYCYYLRVHPEESLPKWLANLASAAHGLSKAQLYIVAEHPSAAFEKACQVAGAGLLILTEDNEFEHVLDFDTTLPAAIDKEFGQRLDEQRRKLENKVHLHTDELKARFHKVVELTRGMSSDISDGYTENVERQVTIWSEWGDATARRLDDVLAQRRPELLDELEQEIERGPVLDEDVN